MKAMASVTIRNLPDETHRALRVRAAMKGLGTDPEIRAILENAVRPEGRIKLGSLLAEIGAQWAVSILRSNEIEHLSSQ